MKERRPRCPKCHKPPESYLEVSEAYTTFYTDDQGRPDAEGFHSSGGPILHVEARCARGHKWRLRNVLQITDLEQQPGADR